MKYFWYTFYPYQEKLQNFWVYMPFKVRIIKKNDMYYNAELYYISCKFIYQFIY